MNYNYRCSLRKQCGARVTLKQPIDWYKRRPKCPCCKKDTLMTVNAKEKARNKRRVCRCGGYSFPHCKGVMVWCTHHPTGPQEGDVHPEWGAI